MRETFEIRKDSYRRHRAGARHWSARSARAPSARHTSARRWRANALLMRRLAEALPELQLAA